MALKKAFLNRKTERILHLVITLIFITGANIYAQPFQWVCSTKAGSTNDDIGWSVTNKGIVVGSFKSPTINMGAITLTNTNSGTADIFVANLNNCSSSWAKSFGTVNDDEGLVAATDPLNNTYIAGYFNSSTLSIGNYTLANNGGDDIFLAKIDNSGNVLWARGFGGPGNERPGDIYLYVNGSGSVTSLHFIGNYNAPFTADTYTLNNAGDYDFFWMQFTPSGTVTTAKGYGSSGFDAANCVMSNGSQVYIGGGFKGAALAIGSNTLTNSNSGTFDAFVVKIDNLIETYAYSFGGPGDEQVTKSLGPPSYQNLFAGVFNSSSITIGSSTLVNTSTGTDDIFLATLNPSLLPVGTKTAGGSGNDRVSSLSSQLWFTVLSGTFDGPVINFDFLSLNNSNPGSFDIFSEILDINGSYLGGKTAGGPGNDICNSAAVVNYYPPSELFMTGYFSSPSITFSPSPVLNNSGGKDAFFSVLYNYNITSLPETNSNEVLRIYPNPANNDINLEFRDNNFTAAEVISRLGQVVMHETLTNNKSIILLPNLPDGIYFLKLYGSNSETVCRKFLIQR